MSTRPASPPVAPEPLRVGTKLAFGVGAAGEGVQIAAFNTFALIYFNQVLGLSGTLSGLVTTIALIFDAVSDPIVGSISDRWHSKRLGRRHPFMYASVLPAALCFLALFNPPAGLGQLALFLWLALFSVLLRLSMTCFVVPHLAFGAELSTDYLQRTSVMAFNNVCAYLGGGGFWLFSYVVIFRATPAYSRGVLNPDAYPVFAAIGSSLIVLYLFSSSFLTRDQIARLPLPPEGQPGFHWSETLREMRVALRNPSYRALVLGLLFLSMTQGLRQAIELHVTTFFFELTSEDLAFYGISGPVGFLGAFAFTRSLNERFDKRPTISVAAALLVVSGTLPVGLRLLGLFPANGSPYLVPTMVTNMGVIIFSGSVLAITVMSALADIADEHELATGRRQEGIFYSARTFFAKATSSIGHLLGGICLDVIDFPAQAVPGEVASDTLFRLGLIEGPIAAVPGVLAVYFYSRCGVTRARHAEIRARLEARKRERDPASP